MNIKAFELEFQSKKYVRKIKIQTKTQQLFHKQGYRNSLNMVSKSRYRLRLKKKYIVSADRKGEYNDVETIYIKGKNAYKYV